MSRRAALSLALVLAAAVAGASCGRSARRGTGAGDGASSPGAAASASPSANAARPADLLAARAAADRRQTAAVPSSLSSSSDRSARRAAAHALAEIGDRAAIERLGRALGDDDPEVVAWAAYGLGLPCETDAELPRYERGRIVRALSARTLSLEGQPSPPAPPQPSGGPTPISAIAWSLGRCGGIDASRELARWLGKDPERARAAAFALGAIAQRDRGLEDDVVVALLAAAAEPRRVEEALYPFARGDWSGRPPVPRLAEVARPRLASPGAGRIYAIRAVGRNDGGKPEDLRALLSAEDTTPTERVEALRSLHRLGPLGDAEIAAFATRAAPSDEPRVRALSGPGFGPLRVAVELLGEKATPTSTTSLRAFVGTTPIAAGTPGPIARRLATLRCLAGAGLHPGAPAEAEVVGCAAYDPLLPAALRAELDALRDATRVSVLDRGDATGDRRALLVRLAREGHPRVRERALEVLAKHSEAGPAVDAIKDGLSAKALGVVAAAAQALADRPSLAHALSKTAIHAALDPKAPPPDGTQPAATDPIVLAALDGALSRAFEEADAEAKIALAAAVGSLHHLPGRGFVLRLCGDRTQALRKAARAALALLDPKGARDACTEITDHGQESPLSTSEPLAARRLLLETDAGALTLILDGRFAPVTVSRVVELATAGFYDGTPIHRVVPGFVVQLGDPGGDGYGGAHSSLRCETAPVPFGPYDIGVALAGRDTGSSQLFVTLSRTPHLDGAYSWIGRAEGPWDSVSEGDQLVKAKVQ